MALLIPKLEMPSDCEECCCSYWTEGAHHDYCQAVGYETVIDYKWTSRPDWCPLKEVPDGTE